MQHREFLKSANMAAVLTCLLAITAFLAGSRQTQAQTPGVASGSQIRLAGNTPAKVLNGEATRVSHYNPEQKLRLALAIQPPHMAEEQQFLNELTTKGSPSFHQFLTAEEWNSRFGPSAQDEQKVVDWAVSQGFTVTTRYNHRLAVDVEAPAGAIEKAFGVTINSYQIPAADGLDARTVYSNDSDPAIPSSLSGVVFAVLGLNSIEVARPAAGSGHLTPRPDYVPGPAAQSLGSASKDADLEAVAAMARGTASPTSVTPPNNGYYTPSDFFSSNAYDYDALMRQGHCCNPLGNANNSPKESSIAIASFADVSFSDISNFQAAFPYLAYNVEKIGIDGGYTCGNNDDGCGEVTMDTEWSLATANSEGSSASTAKIFVYEGSNYTNAIIMDVYNHMLDDANARVMSTSWGIRENEQYSSNPEMDTYNSTMQSVDNIFSSMVGQGWTLVAASGDEGAAAGCGDLTAVQFPSADPNVLAAGGTELSEGNPYEVAWTGSQSAGACDSNGGGSTGGISEYFATPGYQSGMGYSKRAVPDMALDSYYGHDVYLNGGWAYLAGTSVAAPMLAGFFAQENAYLLAVGNKCGSGSTACSPEGNPNPFVYSAGRYNDNAHNPFYDMVSGCNSNDVTTHYSLTFYCAGTGYDLVTGWGSANMLQLAWAINWQLIPAYGVPYVSFTGPATSTWYNTNQTVSWTVNDYEPANSYPGTGIAGETQGWDSIPADPTSEPHGGSGNSFYSGPQFTNDSTGCLAFVGNGCSGNNGAQGCHTVHVEGWNNQGQTTGDSTYGPLCYDNVNPTLSIGTNPATSGTVWVNKSVTVTLTAADPGGSNASGIYKTYYGINTGNCYPGNAGGCSVYSAPFTISAAGQTYVYYWSQDNAGNVSFSTSEPYQWISIDETAPTTGSSLSGTVVSGSVYRSAVQVTLNASDTGGSGVKNTYYELDGGGQTTYSTAFTVSALGNHTVKYWSVDAAGNVESAKTVSFSVDSLGVLTSPTPGSTLGSSATFGWTAGVGATKYEFRLGTTGPGSKDVYNASDMTTTALTTGSISVPAYGVTLYARLYSFIDGVAEYNDYTYTESGSPVAAVLTSPTPGSTLSGTSATFSWTAGGGITKYEFRLGTTGVGSKDLYNAADTTTTALSSPLISGIPAYGVTLYARIYSFTSSGASQYKDYTYTESGSPVSATVTSPTPGATLTGTSATFSWTAGGGIDKYEFRLGTTGPGSKDVYNAADKTTTALTSGSIPVPAYGVTLYARIYSFTDNGITQYNDYTYTESGTPVKAVLTSPTPGTTLTSSSVTFSWTAGGGVTKYEFRLGTTGAGSNNVYNATDASTTALTTGAVTVPTTGATLYARLYSYINGAWQYTDYTYTEQ